MKSRNRLTALALAIVMLCAMIPSQVFATGEPALQAIGKLPAMAVGDTVSFEVGLFEGSVQGTIGEVADLTVTSSNVKVASAALEHTGTGARSVVDLQAYATSSDKKTPKEANLKEDGFEIDEDLTSNVNLYSWKDFGLQLVMLANNTSKLALTIPVPEDGYYALAVQGEASSSGATCDFAIGDTAMGEYSFYKTGVQELMPEKTMGSVYLEKGETAVVITKTGNRNQLMLSKLSLIPIGKTVKINLIGNETGETTVTVSGEVENAPVSVSFDFVVKGELGATLSVKNPDAISSLMRGEEATAELLLFVDGLPATAADFTEITAQADDPLLVDDTAVRIDGEKVYLDLKAINVGETAVQVIAEHEEYGETTLSLPVAVKGSEYIYNFLKLHKGAASDEGMDPDEVTDFSQTTMGDPSEINAKYNVYTDPWYFVSPRPSDTLKWGYVQYGLMWWATGPGQAICFAIDVATPGFYNVNMDCLVYSMGGAMQAYIAPINAEDPRAEEHKLGDPIDTYAETQNNCVNYPIDNVYLEKGQYLFSLEITGRNSQSTGYRVGFSALRLSVSDDREFKFRVDRNKVMLNSEEVVEIIPVFNGYEFSVDQLTDVVVTNANEEILAAAERLEDGKLLLDVSALELGEATITVDASYRDEAFTTDLVLEVVPRDELLSASLSAPVSFAEAGEEIQLDASALQFDGTEVFPGDDNVEFDYISSNTDVLTVTDDGVIQTKGMGDAEITLSVTRDGVIKRSKIKFSVTTYYPLVSVSLGGLEGVAVGSSAQYRVSGRLENGMPIPDTATVEWITVANENGAIELSNTGLVKGLTEGTATIKAKVTMVDGSSMETEEMTITVYSVGGEHFGPAEVFIDFKKYASSSLDPRNYTVADAGWEVNSKQTSGVIMGLDEKSFRWQVYGLNCLMNDELLVLDIMIPADGYYQFAVDGGQYAGGSYAQFFMNGKYLGEYDMYSTANLVAGGEVKLNTVELKAGINQLYIKRGTHTENSKPYLYLGSVRFTPVDAMPTKGEVALRASKTQLSMGETAWLYPGTQMSDGTAEYIGYSADTMAQDPNNVIKLSLNGTSIKLDDNNKITPIATGTTTITMNAVIDGDPITKTLDITVDEQVLGSVTASINDSELYLGETAEFDIKVMMEDGREVDLSHVTIGYASSDESVAKVVNGVLETYQSGNVQITVSATMNKTTVSTILPIVILGPSVADVKIKSPYSAIKPNHEGYQLSVVGVTEAGVEVEIPTATVTWGTTTPDLIDINPQTGFVTPKKIGSAVITAQVSYKENSYNPEYVLTVREGKTGPSYYTDARINAMKENIANYEWARDIQASAIDAADALLAQKNDFLDYAYTHLLPSQEIPRGISVGFRLDPNMYICKFCGVDLRKEHGLYEYLYDPFNYPWKIQCPDCRRRLPSNDFASFYQAGLDEHGLFSYEKALADGQEFLKNTSYPEKGEGWGVDDSRGYVTGNTYTFSLASYMKQKFNMDVPDQFPETWTFIGYYAHFALYSANMKIGQTYTSLKNLTDAYLYSRDVKYGRIAAILLDRMADLYPEMYIKPWFPAFFNSDSSAPLGKHVGCIWQYQINEQMVKSYDALYSMYDDPYVINYLSKKATALNIDEDYTVPDYLSDDYRIDGFRDPTYEEPTVLKKGNPKTSGELIRQNIEQNIIAETAEDLYTGQIHGNFGMHQTLAAYTAVVWDTHPDTGRLIDWLNNSSGYATGGEEFIAAANGKRLPGANFIKTITQTVSRDGTGNEAAPGYNNSWIPIGVLDALTGYEGYEAADQFQNPKILMLYKQNFPLTLLRRETAAIGDSGRTTENTLINVAMGRPFLATGDVEMGQYLYLKNGNTTEGMHDDIFDDSSKMAEMVQKIIDEHGEMDLDKSEQMTGFGFSITRGGTKVDDLSNPLDNQRYNYIYYGKNYSHGHSAVMDFEMGAFGMKITTDFGYPEAADGDYKNTYWGKGTISHNLVMVNAVSQNATNIGFPLHFDDSGRVKLIDVEAPQTYTETEEYRRTVMMVEVDDDTAYSVDFFRVKGGNDHIYSFHAVSNNVVENSLKDKMVTQKNGTYAGKNIEVGGQQKLGVYNAFDFLYNVRRASYPGNTFQLDFKIDDIQKVGRNNVHLKMTMLNDFDLTEVALAKGQPPQRDNNPEELEFVLARRQGKDLDSLFTTVFEPYNGTSYIASQEVVPMKRIGGAWEGSNDASKAVKVTLKNGRVDYIVYATNTNVIYKVDDLFEFQGFAGVYTLENEESVEPIYTYMNDGVKIGETSGLDEYAGTVVDFQKDAVLDNYITVSFKGEYDPNRLVGEHIYIENDGVDNGVYAIKGVEVLANGNVKLDLGTITLIRGMVNEYDLSAGYTYNIKGGQKFTIPLATVNDDSPVWTPIATQVVTAGDTLKLPLSATTPSGAEVTYKLASDLRGTSIIDGVFYFSPDSARVGDNHVGITAMNGKLESTIHFTVTVFPSTTGGGGGGGGGGGSGETTEPEITYTDNGDNTFTGSDGSVISAGPDKTPNTADDITNLVKGEDGSYTYINAEGEIMAAGEDGLLGTEDDVKVGTAPAEKFVDLGNHAWAKDAIYRLVEAGVIKGVADDKYAPGAQITRADFAILLVRAWGLTSEEAGTYGDVQEGDYYYNEVGIASALGIVKGVGENKFDPKAPITREQMMVMLCRTLEAQGIELSAEDDVLADYSDADQISEYAVESVKLMVGNSYIQGANLKINPQGNATRAEVAVLLDRILGE